MRQRLMRRSIAAFWRCDDATMPRPHPRSPMRDAGWDAPSRRVGAVLVIQLGGGQDHRQAPRGTEPERRRREALVGLLVLDHRVGLVVPRSHPLMGTTVVSVHLHKQRRLPLNRSPPQGLTRARRRRGRT
ncbi:hypothetical protein MICRO8M_50150 [Microbacterium sp. 8M]|nr:hypothetical protein MICRO8M_50150 [Microbacterium sp. 8M]